jgi:AcrR family transcriptional regulator
MTVKDNIIKAAYELFSTKGFEKTTISDIVRLSGASKGGFYHHFESKQAIIDDILNNYMNDVNNHYLTLFDKYDNLHQVFNGVFKVINDFKKNQFDAWPQLIKMLSFEGNEVVLSKMGIRFQQMTEEFYSRVIVAGNHKEWETTTPEIVAGLWTRELLRIYSEISKLLFNYSEEGYQAFLQLLTFNENLIQSLLKTDKLLFKDEVSDYFLEAKKTMEEMKISADH